MRIPSTTSPATVKLSAFAVTDVIAVVYDKTKATVSLLTQDGTSTNQLSTAFALKAELLPVPEGANPWNSITIHIIGETTAAFTLVRGTFLSGGSSSESNSAFSSGEPGSSFGSSGEGAVRENNDCAAAQGGMACDDDGSSAGSSTAVSAHNYFAAAQADIDSALRLKDSAPSSRCHVIQRGKQLRASWDARSYNPIFEMDVHAHPRHEVQVLITLGATWYEELQPPFKNLVAGDKVFSACFLPTDMDDGIPQDLTLRQVEPKLEKQLDISQVRVVITFSDFESCTVHIVGAHSLPRDGVADEVQQMMRGVFSLVMQLESESGAVANNIQKARAV